MGKNLLCSQKSRTFWAGKLLTNFGQLTHKTRINIQHVKRIFPWARRGESIAHVICFYEYWRLQLCFDVNPTTANFSLRSNCENVSDSINLFKLNSTLLKRADVFKYCYKALNNKNNSLNEAASYHDLLGEKDK